jgi:hypothetical protein
MPQTRSNKLSSGSGWQMQLEPALALYDPHVDLEQSQKNDKQLRLSQFRSSPSGIWVFS